MFRSYLKLAWKVLLRRKFFTAINLFGISFTLMILLVVVAFFDHLAAAHAPEKRLDRMVFISAIRQRMAGGHGWNNGPLSAGFVDKYVRTLHTPEKVGVISITENGTAYAGNSRLMLDLRYTDGNFWQMMDFAFLEGRPFTAAEVKQGARVVVINEHTARSYFGTASGVVGRTIEINLVRYRVAGVVPNVPALRLYSYSDVWLPYSLMGNNFGDQRVSGTLIAILLAKSGGDVEAMRQEFAQVLARVPMPDKNVDRLFAYADPMLASMTRQVLGWEPDGSSRDGLMYFYSICGALALLFMLLPTLNLVNLNVTRILERSSEIGVRKAFGASSRTLVGQFIVENVFLAVLGGVLGLLLAAGVLALLNDTAIVAYSQFGLNWRVFLWGLALAIVFGLLSGVYPAWKMSRLNPVAALRGTDSGK